MNPIYWYVDEPSEKVSLRDKHQEITTYHSLTGNEWLDLLIVAALLLLPVIFLIWNIERNHK